MPDENLPLRKFLEDVPPGQTKDIAVHTKQTGTFVASRRHFEILLPDISLFCETEDSCGRHQMFRALTKVELPTGGSVESFVFYLCRNCSLGYKTFAVRLALDESEKTGTAFKYGEEPQFGPPNPPRLISLFRDDKESFLKGRRAENQSMGIGAFAYYRRVVESQKNRLLEKVIAVCKLYNASPKLIEEIENAKAERQFTKAIEAIKQALPEVLLIGGQNPLALLHDALSEGLHAETDEQCLEFATDIRVVMAAFAERLSDAVREDADLKQSVSRLIQKKANRAGLGNTGRPTLPIEE